MLKFPQRQYIVSKADITFSKPILREREREIVEKFIWQHEFIIYKPLK